jgi:hypothetical protein
MKTAGSEIESWYIIAGILLKGSFLNGCFFHSAEGPSEFQTMGGKKIEEI